MGHTWIPWYRFWHYLSSFGTIQYRSQILKTTSVSHKIEIIIGRLWSAICSWLSVTTDVDKIIFVETQLGLAQ